MATLVVAATSAEVAPLIEKLAAGQCLAVGRAKIPMQVGDIDGITVAIVVTGVGKANAAANLTAVLECGPAIKGKQTIDLVIGLGVAGATRVSAVQVGELLLATEEVFADEGAQTPEGFLSCTDMGLNIAANEGGSGSSCSQQVVMDMILAKRAETILRSRGLAVTCGPMATVSLCSGTAEGDAWLTSTWDVVGESMEGAAWAQVAGRYQVPFLELRGVSNFTGPRNRKAWDLTAAIDSACQGALTLLAPGSGLGADRPAHAPAKADS